MTTALSVLVIAVISSVLFLVYFGPVALHDTTHYAVAGMSMVRDHQNLLYPYLPDRPLGFGNAYAYLQDGTISYGSRTSYPNKLYSYLLGLIYLIRGGFLIEATQWIALASCIAGNVFLFLIGKHFFGAGKAAILLVSVAFVPLMAINYYNGTDGVAYAAAVFLLWLCLVKQARPLVLGLVLGGAVQFRGQLFALLAVLPLLAGWYTARPLLRQSYLPMLIGFAALFLLTSLLFRLHVPPPAGAGGTAFDFYLKHFQSIYGLGELSIVRDKLVAALVNLVQPDQLFVYGVVIVTLVLLRARTLARTLGIAAAIYVAFPLVMYSFDRFVPPQPRYFSVAIPLAALGAYHVLFGAGGQARHVSSLRPVVASLVLMAAVLAAWSSTQRFPWENLSRAFILGRYHFLDFPGAGTAMRVSFEPDDIVIANHALPSAYMRLDKVVAAPPLDAFMKGDNRDIAGLIFVYGDQPPNDFFKPKDWFPTDAPIPGRFVDDHGIRFERVYDGASTIEIPNGGGTWASAHFLIYKNEGMTPPPSRP